jgi:glucosamine-6-phosphate deaminase
VVIQLFDDKREMARVAAERAATVLRKVLQQQRKARLIAATGAAQFAFLEVLTGLPNIDWPRVEMFHLDEYIGIPESHPASFRRFLKERLINKTGIVQHHLLNGEVDPAQEARDVGSALRSTSPSTTPPQISKRKSPTSSSISMRPAADSNSEKAGSLRSRTFPAAPSQ